MTPLFRVFFQTNNASEKWELPASGFSFTEELNNDRVATMQFDYQVLQGIGDLLGVTVEYMLSGTYREVYILDTDNTIVFSGYVDDLQFDEGESDAGTVTVTAKGWWSLLSKRLSDVFVQYTNQDVTSIIADLINYTQALTPGGNLGIIPPVVTTTRAMTWQLRYEVLKDFIYKLTNNSRQNAVDFEIDHQKKAVVYYPSKGSQQNNIILQAGFNVNKYTYHKNFIGNMTNQVTVLGGNTDLDTQLISVQDSEDVFKSNFFLLQTKDSQVNVIDQTSLDDYAKKYITNYKTPRPILTLSHFYENPKYTSYSLGDYLKVVLPKYNINGFYRVIKRQCDHNGQVTLSFFQF